MKPLLSSFEEERANTNGAVERNPQDEVTSLGKIYKSNLLEPNISLITARNVTGHTKVRAETTDDE
jgi:hypothetical protein